MHLFQYLVNIRRIRFCPLLGFATSGRSLLGCLGRLFRWCFRHDDDDVGRVDLYMYILCMAFFQDALLCSSSCVFNICERMQPIQPKRIDGTKCLALLCCSNETTHNVQEQPAASVYMIVMIGTVQQVALNCTDSNRRKLHFRAVRSIPYPDLRLFSLRFVRSGADWRWRIAGENPFILPTYKVHPNHRMRYAAGEQVSIISSVITTTHVVRTTGSLVGTIPDLFPIYLKMEDSVVRTRPVIIPKIHDQLILKLQATPWPTGSQKI